MFQKLINIIVSIERCETKIIIRTIATVALYDREDSFKTIGRPNVGYFPGSEQMYSFQLTSQEGGGGKDSLRAGWK